MTALRRDLAHHDDLQVVLAAAQAVLGEQVDDALALGDGAHERDHDLDVGQAHLVADELQRLALHREAVGELRPRDTARRRGSRSSGSPRAARSARRRARLAYSLDLKSDIRTITGCGCEGRCDRRDALGDALDEELPRAGVRGDVRLDLCLEQRAPRSSSSSSALGWMPICRLMMNSSRARPTPVVGQPGELERLLRRADVHHDLDGQLGHRRRARSPSTVKSRSSRRTRSRCRPRRTRP